MPKPTFFNLPSNKRQHLLDEALREFSHKPYNEVSISSIIKNAQIPRGSFYQYFDDKMDLYNYLIKTKQAAYLDDWLQAIKNHNGDLFQVFKDYYGDLLLQIASSPDANFFRNVFLHMDYKRSQSFNGMIPKKGEFHPDHPPFDRSRFDILKDVDTANLKISSKAEIMTLMHLLSSVFQQVLSYYYLMQQIKPGTWPVEKAQAQFDQLISWIQFGVQKDKAQEEG
ncbi:MAG: TetR family transcriptional regulator [Lactobacillus sp.]|jgi:AcrR family transcriptional regulator|nr:TetR family transcriptional regulator [Lactobacillus sp.]